MHIRQYLQLGASFVSSNKPAPTSSVCPVVAKKCHSSNVNSNLTSARLQILSTETSVYRLAMFPTLIFKWISAAHPAYILDRDDALLAYCTNQAGCAMSPRYRFYWPFSDISRVHNAKRSPSARDISGMLLLAGAFHSIPGLSVHISLVAFASILLTLLSAHIFHISRTI